MSATNTRREWRFVADDDPVVVPQTWADGGRHEPVDPDQTALYAIEARLGSSLQWTVSQRTGDPVRGPHRERSVFRVLHVSADGQWALETEWDARRQEDGWIPESNFASVIARDLDADDVDATVVTQPDKRQSRRAAVRDLYQVDVPVADGAGNYYGVDDVDDVGSWDDADDVAVIGSDVTDPRSVRIDDEDTARQVALVCRMASQNWSEVSAVDVDVLDAVAARIEREWSL